MKRALALSALALAPAAFAADALKPGMYSFTTKMEVPGVPFAMPPISAQNCLTQADVDQGKQYQGQQKDCQMKNFRQTAGKVHYELACKDGTTGSGDFAYTATSMTGKLLVTKDGQTTTMNMTANRTGDCAK